MNDAVPIAFNQGGLVALNVLIACMMFGVSLTLRPAAFRDVARAPRAPLVALAIQHLLLPALASVATWALDLPAPTALGLLLVTACPGGSFSNLLTWLARGNVPLSVGVTAVSSLAAPLLMPLTFQASAWLNPATRAVVRSIHIPAAGIVWLVLLVLVLPLLLGMLAGARHPALAARAERPLRTATTLVFLAFVGVAFSHNLALFRARFDGFFWLVVLANATALALGYAVAWAAGLAEGDRRAIAIEVGIRNSGLGLAVLFTFFPAAGAMMLVTAFWGVWHLVSGLALARWWGRRPVTAAG